MAPCRINGVPGRESLIVAALRSDSYNALSYVGSRLLILLEYSDVEPVLANWKADHRCARPDRRRYQVWHVKILIRRHQPAHSRIYQGEKAMCRLVPTDQYFYM